ncbi:MAG: long-chain fatty acid--CoA ligase [Phreatobacter sp.]|uniref:class I adenylate-forming enzyme family protein n=1 Tax=Phreatobacter sp. TaxID=1966341 RepID=UPI001A47BCB3|nr:fatty acid--CoA ligase family protein [Phreatobacter sp.]MBL8569255.1 long-chain fatty acid--CoA ligase [Phreatobacter sp.]
MARDGDSGLIAEIRSRQADPERPILRSTAGDLTFADIAAADRIDLSAIAPGDVVALVGDFDPRSIAALLGLIDRKAILVPLTSETKADHAYFHEAAAVNAVIEGGEVTRKSQSGLDNPMLARLRDAGHAGLVLFSSGTTGRPKAILHDLELFLARFRTPREALVTLSFLLFDHIGGINTLLHTLFNNGQVVVPSRRTAEAVAADILAHGVELLPTTPTFLRMLLIGGLVPRLAGGSLRVITYGTERMDEPTLGRLCAGLPDIDLRQTYGMSELGILRVKSEARDSLFMKVGGEGVETRIRDADNVLEIRAAGRMLGYLNAPSPFAADGWYDTRDVVEARGEFIRVVGRTSEVINVGGRKILPGEIERAALLHPAVALAKAMAGANPITGEHIEVRVQLREGASVTRQELSAHFRGLLPEGLRPHRVVFETVEVGHRFKRL